MKRMFRAILGVTLLEILLVLAIAAMILIVSVRYYQNATNSQNTNTILQQIQAVIAAADNLAAGSNTYSQVTTANVTAIVGSKNMKTPYGTSAVITIDPQGSGSTYGVKVSSIPSGVCASLKGQLTGSNARLTTVECSSGSTAVLSFTYNAANY